MQANKITGAIITGCRKENSLMTAQMMSAFGEGTLDMHLLNSPGEQPRGLSYFFTQHPFPFSGCRPSWAINTGQSQFPTHFE